MTTEVTEIANRKCKQDTPRSIFQEMGVPRVTCADCQSFQLGAGSRLDWCYSKRKYVRPMDTACERQKNKKRPQTIGVVKLKLDCYRSRLEEIGGKLDAFGKRPRDFWKRKREALDGLSSSLKEIKKGLDAELKNPGIHPQWRQLRNHKKKMLYVLQCMEYTKIGFTAMPVWQRMLQFRNGNPFQFKLIALIPGDVSKERLFHAALAQWSHRTEWFKLCDDGRATLNNMIKDHGGCMVDPPIEYT